MTAASLTYPLVTTQNGQYTPINFSGSIGVQGNQGQSFSFNGSQGPAGKRITQSSTMEFHVGDTFSVSFSASFSANVPSINLDQVISLDLRVVPPPSPQPRPVPVLNAIARESVAPGQPLTFQVTATDPNPGGPLVFSLGSGAPAGATINPSTGVFSWTPSSAQAGATYIIPVTVTDPSGPNLSDTEDLTVAVLTAIPNLQVVQAELTGPDTVTVTYVIWTSQNAPPFELQAFWSRYGQDLSNSPLASNADLISDPSDLTPGFHTHTMDLLFTPPLINFRSYNLIVAIDPAEKILVQDRDHLSAWVCPSSTQEDYYDPKKGGRPPPIPIIKLTNPTAWIREAKHRAALMKAFLGPRHPFHISIMINGQLSIVKRGAHSRWEKMDVVPDPGTGWEQLALAAIHEGFWVHAEKIRLCGQYWPPSPGATGPHLDLYNIL
jgi:hypothetical protein